MTSYDVFNGDADGICSLVQLRLREPRPESRLVTGVKRDIQLLQRLDVDSSSFVTVLDISMAKNSAALIEILNAGATVFYADHHFAGAIPDADNLEAHIHTEPDVCTAMIVNGLLNDAYINWAITGAFGDNLNASAMALAKRTRLATEDIQRLKELGNLINYNGYGASLDDLHCSPSDLYRALVQHDDPLDFCVPSNPIFNQLRMGYEADYAELDALHPFHESDVCGIYVLPNEPWARRISGIFSNQLANASPGRAHAVITLKTNGNYLVSVRAPLNNKDGADEFCRRYPSGGGRAAAAGINDLSAEQLQTMTDEFEAFYRKRNAG